MKEELQIFCNVYQHRNADEVDNKHIERLTELDVFLSEFCAHNNIDLYDLRARSRKQNIVDLRVVVSSILRENYKLSLQRIGLILSRHHSNIVHYLNKHNNYMDEVFGDEDYINRYNKLKDLRLWQ